jgi:dTDP-4-amino-4,6-dideoxygalactose transaminase
MWDRQRSNGGSRFHAATALDGTETLRFQRPVLPTLDEVAEYFELSRAAQWFSNQGPCWSLFRSRLSERVGAYCVPVASATAGLMAAATVLCETAASAEAALLPTFTFSATAQAAIWSGLRPRLLDIEERSWHLDPELLERELRSGQPRPSLVIAVSAFGTPPPVAMREHWQRACRAAGVPLLIDSAAGFGAVAQDGVPIGAQGDVEVVSFHATKAFAIGEGGAVFTRSRRVAERIESTVNFGLPGSAMRGLNGKMSELHAAMGLAVLDRFDAVLAARRDAAAHIRESAGSAVSFQAGCERSTWQFVPVAFETTKQRNAAVAACAGKLEVRFYYEPLHQLAAFGDLELCDGGCPRTEDLAGRLLCLPMANDLTASELGLIVDALGDG